MLLVASLIFGTSLELFRGASGDEFIRYWNVQDTFYDSAVPGQNLGRDLILESGPEKRLLIQFSDLWRVTSGRTIEKAELIFSQTIGAKAILSKTEVIRQPWSEGAGFRSLETKPRNSDDGFVWRENAFTPLTGIEAITVGAKVVLSGLEKPLNEQILHPGKSFGLAFRFDSAVGFVSSDAPVGKPILRLTLGDAVAASCDFSVTSVEVNGSKVAVEVTNFGVNSSSGKVRVFAESAAPIEANVGRFEPGASSKVEVEIPQGTKALTTFVEADEPDLNDSDNSLSWASDAFKVPIPANSEKKTQALKIIRLLNGTILPYSRFSHSPLGVKKIFVGVPSESCNNWKIDDREMLYGILKPLGIAPHRAGPITIETDDIATEDVFSSITQDGDTRDDTYFNKFLPLTYDRFQTSQLELANLQFTDLLCSTDVAILNQTRKIGIPKTLIVTIYDRRGNVVKNRRLEIFHTGEAGTVEKVDEKLTSSSGSLAITPEMFPQAFGTTLIVREKAGEDKRFAVLKGWQLFDAANRVGTDIALVHLTLQSPPVKIDESRNLIDSETKLTHEKNWVEIDLKKDEGIGEVRLFASNGKANQIRIEMRNSGQSGDQGADWYSHPNASWSKSANGYQFRCRTTATNARYIRILLPTVLDSSTITSVQVFPPSP